MEKGSSRILHREFRQEKSGKRGLGKKEF